MAASSRTLCLLDDILQWASQGQRNIRNTIILDGRILRSQSIQASESRMERQHRDNHGFRIIKDICNFLQPRVVLVCNCFPFETSDLLTADLLVSSVSEAGFIETHTWSSGAKVQAVKSFHPEFVAKCQDPGQHTLRELLLKMTVAMAVNLLSGRQIRGPGIAKLRKTVEAGMHKIL